MIYLVVVAEVVKIALPKIYVGKKLKNGQSYVAYKTAIFSKCPLIIWPLFLGYGQKNSLGIW